MASFKGCDIDQKLAGAVRLIGYGDTKNGYGPACLIDVISTPYIHEPHVTWFPWVTAKNKIVNFKWAMNKLSETHEVLLNIEKKHKAFFDHFSRPGGLLRKIGYIEIPATDEKEIHQYQVRRQK